MSADEAVKPERPESSARVKNIALWVLQVLVGLFFVVGPARTKLLGAPFAVELFDDIGAGQWLRYAVGLLELAGGIGLLVPALSGLAALGLSVVMTGATLTEALILDRFTGATVPLVLLLLLALITGGRWSTVRALPDRLGRLRNRSQ